MSRWQAGQVGEQSRKGPAHTVAGRDAHFLSFFIQDWNFVSPKRAISHQLPKFFQNTIQWRWIHFDLDDMDMSAGFLDMWMLYPGLVHLASPVDSLLWLFIPNLRLILAEMMNLAVVIRLFPNIFIDARKSYLPGMALSENWWHSLTFMGKSLNHPFLAYFQWQSWWQIPDFSYTIDPMTLSKRV